MQCFSRLNHQIRISGQLFVFSSMGFESPNRSLIHLLTGTVSQGEVICRGYLENQAFLEVALEDDRISDTVEAVAGQSAHVTGERTFNLFEKNWKVDVAKFGNFSLKLNARMSMLSSRSSQLSNRSKVQKGARVRISLLLKITKE